MIRSHEILVFGTDHPEFGKGLTEIGNGYMEGCIVPHKARIGGVDLPRGGVSLAVQ